jgi:polyisoprenoid-binding protein YceI
MPATVYVRAVTLLLALTGVIHCADAQQRYAFDQRFASIGFSVRHLGLFSSEGQFVRFEAKLVLNTDHPDRTQISVSVEAASVSMSWLAAADMLRSDDFLNVKRYPYIRFISTSVSVRGHDRYDIHGSLQIRDVKRPLTLVARLIREHPNPGHHDEIADFIVTGWLDRAAFGMRADEVFISNRVEIMIKARLELADTGHAG